jgi:predicted RNA-binding Zn-ribbon protein involved in translation (DUF1610 family)
MNKYKYQVEFTADKDTDMVSILTELSKKTYEAMNSCSAIIENAMPTVYINDKKVMENMIEINKDTTENDFSEWYGRWYKCPKCHEKHINRNFKFCPNCGVKLVWINNKSREEK